MYYGYDPTYILVIIGALLSMFASGRIRSTYSRFQKISSARGMTGAETARRILEINGITDVAVEQVNGYLTDHYDPSRKTVRLSDVNYSSSSVAAVSVAAHECGHVLQHHRGYIPLQLRAAIVPIASFGSNFGFLIVVASLVMGLSRQLAMAGVLLFSFGVLFQIITLPVEFNASSRALEMLREYGILEAQEVPMGKKVLGAAALTYVAAAMSSALQLVRLLLIVNRRGRRD